MRFGFDGAIATPILPTGDLGIPFTAFVHVVPPSCEMWTPLPAPPLSIFHVCITSDHMPATIVFGSFGSSDRLEHPVFGSTKRTRSHVCSAVGGAIDAAFLLRSRRASKGAGKDDVRIRRMNENPPDASGLLESHVGPRRAGVGRLVDAVAHDVRVADRPRFTGAGPYRVGIGLRRGQRADRLHRLLVEDGKERAAAVGRLPDAAGRGAEVPGLEVSDDAGDGGESSPARGPEKLELERWRRGVGASARRGRRRAVRLAAGAVRERMTRASDERRFICLE